MEKERDLDLERDVVQRDIYGEPEKQRDPKFTGWRR